MAHSAPSSTPPAPQIDASTLAHLRSWAGKTETTEDRISAASVAGLSATLDRDDPPPRDGTPLPPLWHWIHFLPHARQSALGPDGHPKRGGFLPPVPLPRRMWAGGRLEWHRPLVVGDQATRESRIVSVDYKAGRTGELVFVLVRHEISTAAGLALTEEHDIVYRGNPQPGAAPAAGTPAPSDAVWRREILPDDVLLFRYSALTFNGHRIHYDRRYVTEIEGYPGLIVHGPLIATLLVDLVRRSVPGAAIARFGFRAARPIFDGHPFTVCGRPEADGKTVALWAQDHEGKLCMEATATLA